MISPNRRISPNFSASPFIIFHSVRNSRGIFAMQMRLFSVIVGVVFATAGFGQGSYSVRMETVPDTLSAPGSGVAVVRLALSEGYHVTAPDNGLFAVVPDSAEGIVFGEPRYPKGVPDKFGNVYKGGIEVPVPIRISAEAAPGIRLLGATVTIQQCGESQGVCYPPEDVRVEAKVFIGLPEHGSLVPAAEASGRKDLAGRLNDALERGAFAAFLLVFLGGLLTGFTPCVYPMIPITIAVIGAQASGKKLGGFVLSLFYVLGIAVTFSALGMAAAKTGSLFGSAMSHPIVTVLIAAVFFIMGLSMLGAFVMQMPPALASRLRGKKRAGFAGAFITGLLAGLVVSPCISPLLVVILTWVAKKGSLFLGFGLLFTFALGLGVLFIVIGTFSGALRALPKSGGWMEWIERGFGVLLLALAVLFLKPVLSPFLYACLWAAGLVSLGTFLGAFTPLDRDSGSRQKIQKAAAVLLVMAGGMVLFSAWTGPRQKSAPASELRTEPTGKEGVAWRSSEADAFKEAKASGKPVLIDFTADWCAACRELDEKTWPDAALRDALAGWIPLRMDMTKKNEKTAEAQKRFGILGMPTVVLMSSDRRELGRFTGFKQPDEVLNWLRAHAR
jgi:thiol:disulfide interchange protein DsbD